MSTQGVENTLATFRSLSGPEKKEVATTVAGEFPPPGPRQRDAIWVIVIISFCLVMLGTVSALIACAFVELPKDSKFSPELLVAVFTSVVGFLAGLLVPAPRNASTP